MKTIIVKDECKSLGENVEGKLVVINDEYFVAEYRDAKYQLVLANSGFGCYADKIGSAVYVTECCENPEHYRRERDQLLGEPTEELIAEWKERYGDFNEEVKKKVLGDDPDTITCRPADLIPDELDTLRKECEQWIQQDEDVLTYALFPQVAVDFFKYREAQQTKIDPDKADKETGSYPV